MILGITSVGGALLRHGIRQTVRGILLTSSKLLKKNVTLDSMTLVGLMSGKTTGAVNLFHTKTTPNNVIPLASEHNP